MDESAKLNFEPTEGLLACMNNSFHVLYNKLVKKRVEELPKSGVPVIMIIGDNVIMYLRDDRYEHKMSLEIFHALKSINHGALAVYIALLGSTGTKDELSTFHNLQITANTLKNNLRNESIPEELIEPCESILTKSISLCQRRIDGLCISQATLKPLLIEMQEDIAKTLKSAQKNRLHALEKIHLDFCDKMNETETGKYLVVVPTSHQAAAGEISKSYFLHHFNETESVGASNENRVLSPEGIWDEEGLLDIVVRHMVDRSIGKTFFGDSLRMQRDVLSVSEDESVAELLQ